jgi:hypothetical protein
MFIKSIPALKKKKKCFQPALNGSFHPSELPVEVEMRV